MNRFLLLLALVLPTAAHAFPEMIRHEYVNCNTCHMSPTGGGLLTAYGRALGKEVMSAGRFFFERAPEGKPPADDTEQDFLYGRAALPEWFFIGGDVRALQMFRDTTKERSGRFILMQLDLEGMVEYKNRIRVLGTLGRDEPRVANPYFRDYLISRRHWVSALLGPEADTQMFQLRFGRFYPAYGINLPEHTYVTRRSLGFDEGDETYNLEGSYIGPNFNVFATWELGRPDREEANAWKGGMVQAAYALTSSVKLGANAYRGKHFQSATSTVGVTRDLYGAFVHAGFTPKLYALGEFDLGYTTVQNKPLDDRLTMDLVKLGYEFLPGMHVFGIQEYYVPSAYTDRHTEAYSIGFQYFPRVHWEFQTTYRRSRDTGSQRTFDTDVWLVAHYYL